MRWVYSEADKPPPPPVPKETKSLSAGGFFSSVLRSLNVSSTPQRSPTPLPAEPTPMVDPRMISETNVSLAIYSADVAVKLGSKLDSELLRSTKKRAPSKLSYQLIYVSEPCICVWKQADAVCRQPKTNMMPVCWRITSRLLLPEAYSKGFERT